LTSRGVWIGAVEESNRGSQRLTVDRIKICSCFPPFPPFSIFLCEVLYLHSDLTNSLISATMRVNLADNDPERHLQVERERQAAQAILDDRQSDQLSRDLAHLRLQHEEGMKGDGVVTFRDLTDESRYREVPEEWLTVEAYEARMIHNTDDEIVSLVEAPLLLNKCKTIRSGFLANGQPSIELAYPRLSQAIENIIGTSREPQTLAKAHAVKACLVRPVDKERSISHFKKAIKV
jgi:hypothetical protein